MDVLVIGGGGREHALVWALRRSPSVDRICCTPGNAGIAEQAERWNLPPGDLNGIVRAAEREAVELVVVGPEAPLTSGLADLLEKSGIPCFGPSRRAAVIEGSKAFAKAFMQRHDIPTAPFEVFHDAASAEAFASDPPWGFPVVVKADGLAAGKGVVICPGAESAKQAIQEAMVAGVFGAAGRRVVVEAFLEGTEATVMALCDGERALPLLPSQDHKAVYDGDVGPNTGGMGAYAPAHTIITPELAERIDDEILQPTVRGLAEEDRLFRGVLYVGLMLGGEGPVVLEFNCRFGDPEAQAVVPLLGEDLGERLASIASGSGMETPLTWSDQSCACVILAAPGYPGKSTHGAPIEGLENLAGRDEVIVFHSGTAQEDDRIVTSGGRVLGITGLGASLGEALDVAYGAIGEVRFDDMHYRRDIGRREPASGR